MGDDKQQHRTRDTSHASNETNERVFPARSIAVKSPMSESTENPFNNLQGLRSHANAAHRNHADDPKSPTRSRSRAKPRANASNPGSPRNEQDESAASRPEETQVSPQVAEFTQQRRVNEGDASVVVHDPESVEAQETPNESLMTSRFEHRTLKDGSHHVYTGLKNQEIQACEDEPIHTPGAIQSFGVLITLLEVDNRVYQVQHCSEVNLEMSTN